MVQLANFDRLRPESKQLFTAMAAVPVAVKEEINDHFDEMHGPLNKRSKLAESAEQLGSKMGIPSPVYDPLEEPSPLGLRLKKSPSFLDLIQMRLSQGNPVSTPSFTSSGLETEIKEELNSSIQLSSSVDKMKASNFPASILRIGNWEYVSRYEGDLVAKCYYAKHKLVWEVLDGGLKNKIEIQWSDITALKATYPENGSETLDIVLARRPLFFRETNPQPRKHTLWQATSDFTGGQASIHRRHFLQCHQGLLSKHFEKLILCDPRLKSLSLQPDIILESSCFEPSCSEDTDESKCLGFDRLKENHESSTEFHDPKRLCAETATRNIVDAGLDLSSRQMHFNDSGISAMGAQQVDDIYRESKSIANHPLQLDQLKVPKLRASMSKDDLVSHLEQCISEQVASGNPFFSADCLINKEMLEEWADYFLADTQSFVSDEKSLLSKVNSLKCLLQKAPSHENLQSAINNAGMESHQDFIDDDFKQTTRRKAFDDQQTPCGISRTDSIGEYLMNFPRIASIPQHLHLFSIEEDDDDQCIF